MGKLGPLSPPLMGARLPTPSPRPLGMIPGHAHITCNCGQAFPSLAVLERHAATMHPDPWAQCQLQQPARSLSHLPHQEIIAHISELRTHSLLFDLGFDDMCQVPTAVYDKDTTHPFPAFCLSGTLPE